MNMKMSDVFELPLFAKNHEVGARCSIYEGFGVTVASSFYANQLQSYEAICHAVNNHDRLNSENARLLDQLTTITKQRDELLSLAYELVDTLKSIGNDCGAEDTSEHIAVILSTIKEQKDAGRN